VSRVPQFRGRSIRRLDQRTSHHVVPTVQILVRSIRPLDLGYGHHGILPALDLDHFTPPFDRHEVQPIQAHGRSIRQLGQGANHHGVPLVLGLGRFTRLGREPPLDKILDPFTRLLDQGLARNGIRFARAQDPIVRRPGRDLSRHIHQLGRVRDHTVPQTTLARSRTAQDVLLRMKNVFPQGLQSTKTTRSRLETQGRARGLPLVHLNDLTLGHVRVRGMTLSSQRRTQNVESPRRS
jgi:hypothetical protein